MYTSSQTQANNTGQSCRNRLQAVLVMMIRLLVHLLDPSLLEARCGNAAELALDLAASVPSC